MKEVTLTWLNNNDACEDQVELFKQTFGESAALTKRSLLKAARAGLDLDWFARNYVSPDAFKAYNEATAAAWKAYEEARAAAWKAYDEATAAAWKAYEEVRAPARKAYQEVRAPARKAYQEATAAALWEAIKKGSVK